MTPLSSIFDVAFSGIFFALPRFPATVALGLAFRTGTEDETRLAARTFAAEFAQSDAGGKNERRWDGIEGFEKAAAKKRELPVGRAFREREGNDGRRL